MEQQENHKELSRPSQIQSEPCESPFAKQVKKRASEFLVEMEKDVRIMKIQHPMLTHRDAQVKFLSWKLAYLETVLGQIEEKLDAKP